jgi:endo-1,4-beta-xylanase
MRASLGFRIAAGFIFVASAVAGCIIHDSGPGAGGSVGGNLIPASDLRPLRQAGAAAHRRIGTAMMSDQLAYGKLKALVAREFDSLTPENEMKWEAIEPQSGVFSFAAGDRLVSFAAENGIRVRGHTLVWHSQLAPWAKGMRADSLRAAMTRHIQNVVGHWQGKIAQWDVVNEALADGPTGELRPDSPFAVMGPGFIDEAFRLAHAADPQAQLFYNDYEIEAPGSAKAEAAYALCKRLKDAGVPIHGIGFQMHVDPRGWPSGAELQRNFERFAALGLAIEITEMDVPVGALPGDIDEKLRRQREITRDIVAACVAVDKCSGITFWGVTDNDSWLNSPRWGAMRGPGPHYPLPFNTNLQPKPMAAGILDGLAPASK